MLIDDSVQSNVDLERKAFQDRITKDGLELWKRQKEYERQKKIKEQKEIRDMLDRYWPWGRGEDAKPRGLRNLRMEEIFPNRDFLNAKRFVGTLDLGRGGGGAPIISGERKLVKTREDPLLRFQFGSKDLRRCVDNTLRYKTDKIQQMEYKKQLDKLVEEKKSKEKEERNAERKFHQEQGWSDERTLKELETETLKSKLNNNEKCYENFKKMNLVPPNKVIKLDPIIYPRKTFIPVGRNRRLSPLSNNKDDGVELVTLFAKERQYPKKIPLCSSDVTSEKKMGNCFSTWNREGSGYLRELVNQMTNKQKMIQEMKAKENETAQRHFTTWDGFWGRPGHGAPLPEIKKQSLDQLLYPQMTPIGVH